MNEFSPSSTWSLIAKKLSDQRVARMESVAKHRTRHIQLVMQDVHDPHNISACLRSAEAFGIQEIHIICPVEKFSPSTASRGSASWLSIRRWQSIAACANHLHNQGLAIAAGFPSQDAISLEEIPVVKPMAVLFGNEHAGIAPDWLPFIDIKFTIPMVGMVESFNISVAAALTLFELRRRSLATLGGKRFYLPGQEVETLLCQWAAKHSRNLDYELKRLRGQKV